MNSEPSIPRIDREGGAAAAAARLPGDAGLWIFIIADMGAFAMFFLVFAAGRIASPELYEQSRRMLDVGLGLTNTLILLTSSLFMARAVESARVGNRAAIQRNLILTMLVGSGFAVSKITEYTAKGQAGISILTNEFFTYYFAFTGIHFLHFVVGMGGLAVCLSKARRDAIDDRFVIWIEATGCYWHMVDLLWIMLFPMLYLLRAA